jgi:hypothetical protein
MKINNDKFYPWLLGFSDAECSFLCYTVPRINKQNIITNYRILFRIQIGLNIKDKPILEMINNKLGDIGKIYDYYIKEESTLCFISVDSIKYLIENIFSKYPLLTSYQANRYDKLRIGILEKRHKVKSIKEFNSMKINLINPKFEDQSLFYLDHWLVGFLNGEVSFTQFRGNTGKLKPKISLEHTSELAVNFFKTHLKLGPKVFKLKQRENRQITYRIDVTSVADLSKICHFLDRTDCLLGNKFNQYQI